MTADTTGRTPRRSPSPLDDPRVAGQLRRIALHQETPGLLELPAGQATSARDVELLRRRAAGRREPARQLRGELATGQAARPAS